MKTLGIILISILTLYLLVWEFTSRYYEYPGARSSPTMEISKHLNVYIGSYRPARPFLVIEDSLRFKIPDMWVEHRWNFTSDYKLERKFILTDGYNAFLPFRQKIRMFSTNNYATNQRNSLDNNYDLPKKYFIQLYRIGKEMAKYPGTGYYVPGGYYEFSSQTLLDCCL